MQRCLEVQDEAAPRGRVARLLGASPLHPDAVSWYRGALGELETSRQLAKLGTGYTVLHSLPLCDAEPRDAEPRDAEPRDAEPRDAEPRAAEPRAVIDDSTTGSDVDHLVIGAAGVFCLTSTHDVTNARLAAAEASARRVSKHLSRALQRVIPVKPVVVKVSDARTAEAAVDHAMTVEVVTSRSLSRWFSKRGPVLTVAEIATIALAAEQPSTWHAPAAVLQFAAPVEDFEDLQQQVDAATARERVALAVTILLAIATVLVTGAEIVAAVAPHLVGV